MERTMTHGGHLRFRRRRRRPFFTIVAAALAAGNAWPADESSRIQDSVILIRSVRQDSDPRMPWKQLPMQQGSGTGFVIDGDRVLTNAHNVCNCKYVELRKESVARRFMAKVAFIGHDCDLAILVPAERSFFEGSPPLPLGGIPAVDSTVSTYGFPVGGSHVSVTKGVVSRIQSDVYSLTGADEHLVIQTDAAINPGNSGGPVVQEGSVVGVAFQGLRQADNIGYMIPTTVIRHFLADIQDGTYDGYASLGFSIFRGLHNPSYRDYLMVPAGQEGVVVTRTLLKSSAASILAAGDVVTKIGDHDVDNEGMIRIHDLRLDMSEAVEQKQMGESIAITFYRRGEPRTETLKAALNRSVLDFARRYDQQPRYVVYAGLVFVALSRNYLETWGSNWVTEIPDHLRRLFVHAAELNVEPERREYVVLSEILPDEVNRYAGSFKDLVIESVNGVLIWGLDDLPGSFEKPSGGFQVLTFMENHRPLVLEAEKAIARNEALLKKYGAPAAQSLGGRS
jgi:S1-C subfamily serine protease